mgnify:CR=1 FL=1
MGVSTNSSSLPGELGVIRRHAERSVPEDAAQILAEGVVAHVAWEVNGQPVVIPFGYQFDPSDPEHLYLHGSPGSSTLSHLANGKPVSIAVTLVDGFVFSRTALNHSMNYRSVVCFGSGRLVLDREQKRRMFADMTLRYLPGRTEGKDYQGPTDAQLDSTQVIEITLHTKSAKCRRGGPTGPLDNVEGLPETCGVVQLRETREVDYWPKNT